MSRRHVYGVAAVAACALMAWLAPSASAAFPQFQISHFGAEEDLTQQVAFPAVAYDSRTNQYLVVYTGGTKEDENHWKVYGQLVGANGAPVGGQFQISAETTNRLCTFEPPSVAYDANADQFLVTWDEGTTTTCDDAIYVQRVTGGGALVGPESERISETGYEDIETTAVVYNPSVDEWFVAWNAEGPGQSNQELWGQRLKADGTETGENDQQLTHMRVSDTTNGRTDDAIGLALDSRDSRYLVVVRGIDKTLTGGNTHDEIFGHLMNADGSTVGPDHFLISHVLETNPNGQAFPPHVEYDSVNNQFLVAWTSESKFGLMAEKEIEVFGHLVGSDGTVTGGDTRYSNVGLEGSTLFRPLSPVIGFDPNTDEYLLSWSGDNNKQGVINKESEVWGQRVSGAGALLDESEFRISKDGPEENTEFAANRPALAFNSATCEYLDVWSSGNVGSFGGKTEKWNIWANLIPAPPPCPHPTSPGGGTKGGGGTPILVLAIPRVTNARQSNARWREGRKLAQISKKKKPPIGTTFSFTLNTQATVSFNFTQRLPGRKVGQKCVAQTKKNRHKKSCTRTVTAGTLSFTGHVGTNKVKFQGLISRSKKLKPGRYTLVITAANSAGARSAPISLSFTIVK